MKIVTTTVSRDGYREVRSERPDSRLIDRINQERLVAYEQALIQASHAGVDLLCLPGGYFYYASQTSVSDLLKASESELADLIKEIIRLAKKYRVAIAVGVDLTPKDQTADNTQDVLAGTLPWYALCWGPLDDEVRSWKQRSVTSTDQFDCPEELCNEARTLRLDGGTVEVLMCGEVFNSRIRTAVGERRERPVAVVDLVHTLAGFRPTAALNDIAYWGIHAFCSGHADKHSAMKYYYAPGCIRRSSTASDFVCGSAPRIEAKIWDI